MISKLSIYVKIMSPWDFLLKIIVLITNKILYLIMFNGFWEYNDKYTFLHEYCYVK